MTKPLITVVVPSYNQAQFLDRALLSIFEQNVPVEVFVEDGGSTDNSLDIIKRWESHLTGWRSSPDTGQAAAINIGVNKGSAPYVCWLNSDDMFLAGGLKTLLEALDTSEADVVYGECWHINEDDEKVVRYLTLPFNQPLLANYCFIAQPATLIRRSAWEAVKGLSEQLQLAMDYDLWWKLVASGHTFFRVKQDCAANRLHGDTKTHNQLDNHYRESIQVVKRHYGRVPIKWYLFLPVMKLVRKVAALRYR